MSTAMSPCPPDHPLMVAWNAYTKTEDYANSYRWAVAGLEYIDPPKPKPGAQAFTKEHSEEFVKGSLWAAFMAGFNALSARLTPPADVVLKRYEPAVLRHRGATMVCAEDGEWVRYEDHAAALAASEAKRKEAETQATDDFEHYVRNAIDSAPEPLRRLGEYLTEVLDEDQWAHAEPMLLGAALDQPKTEDAA